MFNNNDFQSYFKKYKLLETLIENYFKNNLAKICDYICKQNYESFKNELEKSAPQFQEFLTKIKFADTENTLISLCNTEIENTKNFYLINTKALYQFYLNDILLYACKQPRMTDPIVNMINALLEKKANSNYFGPSEKKNCLTLFIENMPSFKTKFQPIPYDPKDRPEQQREQNWFSALDNMLEQGHMKNKKIHDRNFHPIWLMTQHKNVTYHFIMQAVMMIALDFNGNLDSSEKGITNQTEAISTENLELLKDIFKSIPGDEYNKYSFLIVVFNAVFEMKIQNYLPTVKDEKALVACYEAIKIILLAKNTLNKTDFKETLSQKNEKSENVLHMFCKQIPFKEQSKKLWLEIFQLAVKDENIKKGLKATNKWKKLPLHLACQHQNVDANILDRLLDSNNIKTTEEDNRNGLHLLCENSLKLNTLGNCIEIYLKKAGENKSKILNARDKFGKTPLYLLCEKTGIALIPLNALELLLKQGADPNVEILRESIEDKTCLQILVSQLLASKNEIEIKNRLEAITLILDHTKTIDKKNLDSILKKIGSANLEEHFIFNVFALIMNKPFPKGDAAIIHMLYEHNNFLFTDKSHILLSYIEKGKFDLAKKCDQGSTILHKLFSQPLKYKNLIIDILQINTVKFNFHVKEDRFKRTLLLMITESISNLLTTFDTNDTERLFSYLTDFKQILELLVTHPCDIHARILDKEKKEYNHNALSHLLDSYLKLNSIFKNYSANIESKSIDLLQNSLSCLKDMVKSIAERTPDKINEPNPITRQTILHCACQNEPDLDLIKLLIEYNADPLIKDGNQDTPLSYMQTKYPNMEHIILYLQQFESQEKVSNDQEPLHEINPSNTINIDDHKSELPQKIKTPIEILHNAIEEEDVYKIIEQLKIIRNQKMLIAQVDKKTILALICSSIRQQKYLNLELIKLLLDDGEKITQASLQIICQNSNINDEIIEFSTKNTANFFHCDTNKKTAFDYYLDNKHKTSKGVMFFLKYIIRELKDDNVKFSKLFKNKITDNENLLFFCLKNGIASKKITENLTKFMVKECNDRNQTVLHCIGLSKKIEPACIKILIEKEIDEVTIDREGNAAVHYLCESKAELEDRLAAIKYFSPKCLSLKNAQGDTPLHLVMNNENCSIEMINHFCSDFNLFFIENSSKLTPLDLLIKRKDIEFQKIKDAHGLSLIEFIIKKKPSVQANKVLGSIEINPSEKNNKGQTYLHSACSIAKPSQKLITLLEKKGFSFYDTDNEGKNCLDYLNDYNQSTNQIKINKTSFGTPLYYLGKCNNIINNQPFFDDAIVKVLEILQKKAGKIYIHGETISQLVRKIKDNLEDLDIIIDPRNKVSCIFVEELIEACEEFKDFKIEQNGPIFYKNDYISFFKFKIKYQNKETKVDIKCDLSEEYLYDFNYKSFITSFDGQMNFDLFALSPKAKSDLANQLVDRENCANYFNTFKNFERFFKAISGKLPVTASTTVLSTAKEQFLKHKENKGEIFKIIDLMFMKRNALNAYLFLRDNDLLDCFFPGLAELLSQHEKLNQSILGFLQDNSEVKFKGPADYFIQLFKGIKDIKNLSNNYLENLLCYFTTEEKNKVIEEFNSKSIILVKANKNKFFLSNDSLNMTNQPNSSPFSFN